MFKKNESGQSMVEFALTSTIFLLLVFGMFDIAYYFYGRVTLQNAVRQAARYAITGNCSTPGSCFAGSNGKGGGTGDRLNSIINTVKSYSFGLNPTVTVKCVPFNPLGCGGYYGDGGTNNAGGPMDTVIVTATYTWGPWVLQSLLPKEFSSGLTYKVSSTFKNETFPPANP